MMPTIRALLLWVHATLVDSGLSPTSASSAPLSAADRSALYEESRVSARLFGIPPRLIPPTLRDFRRYMRDMLGGPTLAVGQSGRAIAAALLSPPLPFGLRQLAGIDPALHHRPAARSDPPSLRLRVDEPARARAAGRHDGDPQRTAGVAELARTFPHARRASSPARMHRSPRLPQSQNVTRD